MKDIYLHLQQYGLSKRGKTSHRLERISEAKISDFLNSYLQLAHRRPLAITSSPGAMSIYPDSRGGPLPDDIIRQLAIYVDRIYIHDPLIQMALEWQSLDANTDTSFSIQVREVSA